MALPLKSGADLYNNQALRLRLHNLGADPTEVGAGLIYFNTSTGLNTSQKARLYTGSAWKTIAFSEDLDVASNADFLALKDRVDLLSGDVDTDAIISNMKEVSAFLEGFAEDASLMDYLNIELGKKLDKAGGTITSSNYDGLIIKRASDSAGALIAFENNGGRLGLFGFEGAEKVPIVYLGADTSSYKYLLHSGNVGEYAMNVNKKLDIQTSVNEAGYAYTSDGWRTTGAAVTIGASSDYRMAFQGDYGSTIGMRLQYGYCNDGEWKGWKTIAFTDSNVASAQALTHSNGTVGAEANQWGGIDTSNTLRFLARDGESQAGYIGRASSTSDDVYLLSNNALRFFVGANATQAMLINSSGNVTIGASDLTETVYKLYVDGKAKIKNGLSLEGSGIYWANDVVNYSIAPTSNFEIIYTGFRGHWFKTNGIDRFRILQNGNVLIGTTEDDGKNKLQVAGKVSFGTTGVCDVFLNRANGYSYVHASDSLAFTTGGIENNISLILRPNKNASFLGNVLIGTATDNGSGAKLQVAGDLHVTGNIIADGEVSAGGAGEEGGNAGGGGAFHSEGIAVGATQTTIAHGLGTDDIVVSIYEKDGVSGRWSIILTDVEIVDANNIIVSFGSATSVEHKVVIMGAVA